ncbi:phiSA1p31-related protein [Streptomyces californicus]|uniref:phiSA1p31-related protein n=1 Tax=Streptomyces californicus TaxID=67351 RepID=UPI00380F9239
MTDTPVTPDREPSRREELLFMLLHGGARDAAIAQRVVDLALAEARAEQKAEVDRLRKALSDVAELESDLGGATAHVASLKASVCRCFDPSHHNPGCEWAVVVWNGVKYNAAAWYRDAEGEWWMACAIDDQGQPLMRVWNDPSNEPVPASEVESDYGPLYRSDDGPDELRQPEGF